MQIQLELSIDDKAIGSIVEQFRQVVEKTLVNQLGKIKVEVAEQKTAPKPSQPTVIVPEGVDLPEAERLKAADLRTALLAGKIPDDSGILLDGEDYSKVAQRILPNPLSIVSIEGHSRACEDRTHDPMAID